MRTSPLQFADLIDRERTAAENAAIREGRKITYMARIHAYSAMRVGADPVQAVRDVFYGNEAKNLPGIRPILVRRMALAHIKGRWRSEILADRELRDRGQGGLRVLQGDIIRMASTDTSAYNQAVRFLTDRLKLTPSALAKINKAYETEAMSVTDLSFKSLERRLQESLLESLQKGASVPQGMVSLKKAFERAGFDPVKDYQLETIFRTQTQMAYGAGRWQSLQDEQIQEMLVSFTYVTVGDDRVRPDHVAMDGVTRPKDDLIWNSWWAPCGYNCRCTNLENYERVKLTPPSRIPKAEPDQGFDFNPGKVFQDHLISVEAP